MHESVEFFCGVPPRLMHYQGMLAMGFDTCVASFGSWSLWVAKPYYSRVGPKTGRPRTRSLAGPLLQRQRGNAGSCQLLGGGGTSKLAGQYPSWGIYTSMPHPLSCARDVCYNEERWPNKRLSWGGKNLYDTVLKTKWPNKSLSCAGEASL